MSDETPVPVTVPAGPTIENTYHGRKVVQLVDHAAGWRYFAFLESGLVELPTLAACVAACKAESRKGGE